MAPTPIDQRRTLNFQRLEQIPAEDRQQLKADAKNQVSALADEVAGAPVGRPTAQTSADTRRAVSYDPVAQQIYARAHGQVPTVTTDGSTVRITGTEGDDRIRVEQGEGQIRAWYTDENEEEQELGSWNSADVERLEVDGGEGDDLLIGDHVDERVTLSGNAGDDELVNRGEDRTIDSATLDGGEGDDLVVNTRTGATIRGGAGENEIYNSGDHTTIGGEGEDVESSDYVFNSADGAEISYQNAGGHQIASIGDANSVDLAGDGGTVNVAGDQNAVRLGGRGNDVTVQGDLNGVIGNTGYNAVRAAGSGNVVDLIGTGNLVDVNGDVNTVNTDNAAGILLDNFDDLDADGDGFLLPEEIRQVPGAEEIADHADALMFGSIQQGSNAWHGLSREDLQLVADRMYGGETLHDIADDLMQSSWLGQQIAAGGGEVDADSFAEAVERYRLDNPRPDVDPMDLTPLIDVNVIGVQGDFNRISAPGPGSWVSYEGVANEVGIGSEGGVYGLGDYNQVALGGPNSSMAFIGSGNQIASGGGNAIVGRGDLNLIDSYGFDLIDVEGFNFINEPALQTALAPYLAEMAPELGMEPELLIALLMGQGQQRGAVV